MTRQPRGLDALLATGSSTPERDVLRLLRRGDLTAASAIQGARAALEDVAALGGLVRDPDPTALQVARDCDDARVHGRPLGSLHGLPVVVKDNIAVAGLPLAGASPALTGYSRTASAGAVQRLTGAGAVVAAQTNMHELAMGTTSNNLRFGPVRNPWNPLYSAGGSSGGTAAVVAAGAVMAGLATDTGGSGRIPAAACGCVGFRPSTGRYPSDGVLTLSKTMDTVAVIARSVDGVTMLDSVLAADDDEAPSPLNPHLVRLGVPRSAFWTDVDAQISSVCRRALDRLEAAGMTLVEVDLDRLRAVNAEVAHSIAPYEIRQFWNDFSRINLGLSLSQLAQRLASPDVAAAMEALAAHPPFGVDRYHELLALCDEARSCYDHVFSRCEVDAVVFPTMPAQTPRVGESIVRINGERRDAFLAMTSHCTPASISGIPAISIPAGIDGDGLPVGLELDGPRHRDRRLLAVAAAAETVLGALPLPMVAM